MRPQKYICINEVKIMALIRKCKQVTTHKKETQYVPEHDEPDVCPKCGEESLYEWSSERYGGYKTSCFSAQCHNVFSIGMIRGDIREFSKQEYKHPGNPTIGYPKADGYSAELRENIQTFLTAWGFRNITFKEPGATSNNSHTIIRGNHISPSVNIGYKGSPQTDRILCFDNKYGVVHITTGYYDHGFEKDHYRQWSNTVSSINGYLQRAGIKPNYLGNMDQLFVLPNRENLREAAIAGILQSRKNDVLSQICSRLYKIKEYERKIISEGKNITDLKTKFKTDFGEEAPEQKVNY